MNENTSLPAYVLLRLPEVMRRVGLSRSVIYERIRRGAFPKPVNLGGHAVGWLESEINQWINSRVVISRRTS